MTNIHKNLKCISPIDGSIYAERPITSIVSARASIANVRVEQKKWNALPLKKRIEQVRKAVASLGEMNEEIVPELARTMGRPIRYGGEFNGVNERASYMADIAEEALKPIIIEESEQFGRRIEHEAHGVILVIAPWNYPYMTAINSVAPALIAGNGVVLKHSTQTLLAGERMEKAFIDAGLPQGLFINLYLDHSTTEQLIQERSFDFINFTGSVGGGKAIERAAAGTFCGIGLELGGKDPGYVMEDADLGAAVETLIDGAMFNSGQSCCGIERIYVVESLYDDFIKKAVEIVGSYKLGNPLEESTTIGPMASVRFANEVRNQINEALAEGATALIDPSLFPEDDGGAYLAPQILVNVSHDMKVMREESFGPVVGIMKVKDDAEAIALMNDSDYGLSASLWTTDSDRAAHIGGQLETGTIFMNRADYLDPALCWTGCKDTGRGGSLSIIGFQNLTRPKSYHFKKV